MDYRELLALAQQNPEEADFHSLRMAYTRSPEYAPYSHATETLQSLGNALRENDLGAALGAIMTLLDHNYLDIEAHMAADYVYTSLGDNAESGYHRAFAKGLIGAIAATGDGKGPDSAFIVISVPEEHTLLRALGLRASAQVLVQEDGHWFDLIDTQHPVTGEPMQVYFNVDIPRHWLAAQHSDGRGDPPDEQRDA